MLGTQPSWWTAGADGRADGPFASPACWVEELITAGFELQGVSPDGPEPFHVANVILAKRASDHPPPKCFCLVGKNGTEQPPSALAAALSRELNARGFTVSRCSMDSRPPAEHDIVVLWDVEEEMPFFGDTTAARLEHLKTLLQCMRHGEGLVWVTRRLHVRSCNPQWGLVSGFARTMRGEMSVDFATCETNEFVPLEALRGEGREHVQGLGPVVDVLCSFHGRVRGEKRSMGPDFEYVIADGVVRVNRIMPFRLKDNILAKDATDEAFLTLSRPGRLESLHWTAMPPPTLPQGDEVEIEIHATGLNFRVRAADSQRLRQNRVNGVTNSLYRTFLLPWA